MKTLTLDDLNPGTKVIAVGDYYRGLIGYVDEVLTGADRITENEGEVDIVCDFEEVKGMKKKYPELNGTSVSSVAMCLEELAIILDDGTAVDMHGNVYMAKELVR